MREVYTLESPLGLPGDPQALPKWKWREPVHYGFHRGWRRLREAPGMTPAAYALFFGLCEHLGWDNGVTDSLARVARVCGLGKRTVPRVLRMLEEACLIAVDRSIPTLLRITVSPHLVWQGRPHLVYQARRAFDARCEQAQAQAASAPREHTAACERPA